MSGYLNVKKECPMKVTNINGTSDNICKCGTWFDHWKKFSGQTITYCPVGKCYEKELVGAHVQKDGTTDRGWYIIPLCKKHNGEKGKSLNVNDVFKLVSANVNETCGKKNELNFKINIRPEIPAWNTWGSV
jgi:hypothetical protein